MNKEQLEFFLSAAKEQLKDSTLFCIELRGVIEHIERILANQTQSIPADFMYESIAPVKYFLKGKSGKRYNVPLEYNPMDTWNEKIVYVISLLNESFIEDIVNYILSKEVLDKTFVTTRVNVVTSRLKKDGVFNSVKIGNKNKLSIKSKREK